MRLFGLGKRRPTEAYDILAEAAEAAERAEWIEATHTFSTNMDFETWRHVRRWPLPVKSTGFLDGIVQ